MFSLTRTHANEYYIHNELLVQIHESCKSEGTRLGWECGEMKTIISTDERANWYKYFGKRFGDICVHIL